MKAPKVLIQHFIINCDPCRLVIKEIHDGSFFVLRIFLGIDGTVSGLTRVADQRDFNG